MNAPTTDRKGDWIQTYTGRQFWPLDPREDEIEIEDIAHALALQCRFGGHCALPYSVAEHSARVSRLVEEWAGTRQRGRAWALAGLLHDAAEAYLVDVPRPIKRASGFRLYREAEAHLTAVIAARFGLTADAVASGLVAGADETLLATEARDLMPGGCAGWPLHAAPLDARLFPFDDWREAKAAFLARFAELGGQ